MPDHPYTVTSVIVSLIRASAVAGVSTGKILPVMDDAFSKLMSKELKEIIAGVTLVKWV